MFPNKHTISLDLMKGSDGALSPDKVGQLQLITGADCFIETGTYLGNTTSAMRSLFGEVISIELSEELHLAAKERFAADNKVILLQGNSADRIGDALARAQGKRPLIWLDAHWSGGNTAKAGGNTPILAEIEGIRRTGVSDVVILIDDISFFWSVHPGFNVHDSIGGYPEVELLMEELYNVNRDFSIVVNGDIMVAIPKPLMGDAQFSPVLEATSKLRTGSYDSSELPLLESTVAGAEGGEKQVILKLPDFYGHALSYGIGGHFCYWRGLVNEQDGRLDEARRDFALARDCGVSISTRGWEG